MPPRKTGKRYATRARPHVDRCATAWLIRRFVDPKARFVFLQAGQAPPKGAEPFDLPGARLGHKGGACTFEVALKEFGLARDAALRDVADLVADLDLHQLKRPESPGLDAILTGLKLAEPDDRKVLARADLLFDALYARAKAARRA